MRRHLTFSNICAVLALVVALGTGGAYAANTVRSKDIVNGQVKTKDLAASAVDSARVKDASVTGADVAPESLDLADLAGTDRSGSVSFSTGAVANGRCSQVSLAIAGAAPGDAVAIMVQGTIQNGVVLSGQRVPAAGQVTAALCNLSGTTMAAITDLPIRVVTFR